MVQQLIYLPGIDEEHCQHATHVGNAIMPNHAVDKRPVLLFQPVEDIAVDEDGNEDGGGENQVHPDVIFVFLVDKIVRLDNINDSVKPGGMAVVARLGDALSHGRRRHMAEILHHLNIHK